MINLDLETTIKKLAKNSSRPVIIVQTQKYINIEEFEVFVCINKLIESKELIKTSHGRYYSIENLIDEVLYVINNQIADRDFFCIVLSAHLSIDIETIEEIIKDMINDQTLIIMPGNAKKNGGYYEHDIYGIA